MKAKTIVILVLVLFLLIIILQNTHPVYFRLLFWKVHMSQILLTPLTLVAGFIVGFSVAKLTGKPK